MADVEHISRKGSANPYVSSRMMASKADIKHTLLSGVTPEQARNTRARAWAYIFSCSNQRVSKEAATSPVSRPDDGPKSKEDSAMLTSTT